MNMTGNNDAFQTNEVKPVSSRTAVILAADVVGYSRLIAQSEEETLHRFADVQALCDDVMSQHNGQTFHTAGDAIRAQFATAEDATRAAIDIQSQLKSRNAGFPLARQMMLRIGIAIAEVTDQDGDVHGPGVAIATGLEGLASPGGLCISKPVYDALPPTMARPFADMGIVRPLSINQDIYAFAWQQTPASDGATVNKSAPTPRPLASQKLYSATIGVAVVFALGSVAFLTGALSPKLENAAETTAIATKSAPQPTAATRIPMLPITTAAPPAEPKKSAEAKTAPVAQNDPVPAATPNTPRATPKDWGAVDALAKRNYADCESRDWPRAIAACEALIKDDTLTTSDMANLQLNLGRAQRETGRTDGAIETLSAALTRKPSAPAYIQRGLARFEKGSFDSAIEDFTAAIKLNPNDGEAYNNRAWTYFKTARLPQASADSAQAVKFLPNAAYVWDTSGHIHEAQGKRDAAITDFKRAISLDDKYEASRAALKRLGSAP
jgi:class 3 adenylate cyclase/tetratricopeptide (TPR) repeat protein